mmetsp:Transcript_27096/g.39887  ORF Transcript_27096/g.39887 Transcript_27096/m.39887 type:complete len:202 (-) Transcript_27096:1288-1893(-)
MVRVALLLQDLQLGEVVVLLWGVILSMVLLEVVEEGEEVVEGHMVHMEVVDHHLTMAMAMVLLLLMVVGGMVPPLLMVVAHHIGMAMVEEKGEIAIGVVVGEDTIVHDLVNEMVVAMLDRVGIAEEVDHHLQEGVGAVQVHLIGKEIDMVAVEAAVEVVVGVEDMVMKEEEVVDGIRSMMSLFPLVKKKAQDDIRTNCFST